MKQLMGFKADAAAKAFGTNLDVAGGLATSPEKLGAGNIGFFGKKGTFSATAPKEGYLIPLKAAADFLDVKSFIIARGNAVGSNTILTDGTAEGATLSDSIDRKTMQVEKYPAVVPGTAKVLTLGGANNALIGGATPPAVGSFAGVTIVDTDPNIHSDWKSKSYEVQIKTAAADASVVATALATKINANPASIVVASVVGATTAATLVLTHKKAGVNFDAHGVEGSIMEFTTKTVTTVPVAPEGTPAAIKELELDCQGHQGGTRRGDGQLGDILPYTQVDPAATSFALYVITWERSGNRQGTPVDNKFSRFLRLYLAVPTISALMQTDIETILGIAASEETAGQSDEQGKAIEAEVKKRRAEEDKRTKEAEEEAEKERKKNEAATKEAKEREEQERIGREGKPTQLPAEQIQRERQEQRERLEAERGQAEQLPAEQKEREKHEQTLREKQEEKEREEREKGAHRDGHKH